MPKAAAIVMQIALHFHFGYKSAFVLNVRREKDRSAILKMFLRG